MLEDVMWLDSSGSSTDLHNGQDLFILEGSAGLDMPEFKFVTDDFPTSDGGEVRMVKAAGRDVHIHLLVKCSSRSLLREKIRSLSRVMNPKLGNGRLRVTSADGKQRDLICRYVRGLEDEDTGFSWREVVLVFRAWKPFWQSVSERVTTFVSGGAVPFFPIFPLVLSNSAVFSSRSLENQGDTECWPVWTVYGPGENLKVVNFTTSQELEVSITLNQEDTLEIDTRPGFKAVKMGDGSNQFYRLSPESVLWPLQRGENQVQIELSNTNESSKVIVHYVERFLAA